MARDYQFQYEGAVAVQALGRVRFTIKPRTVVFFQRGPLQFALDGEFSNLAEFREHFGLVTERERLANKRIQEIRTLRATGLTINEIAAKLGIATRTVYRNLETSACDTSSVEEDLLQASCHIPRAEGK